MENLKIRVNNEAESKEAQELFFELGYKWPSGGTKVQHTSQSYSFGYLVAWTSGSYTNVIQCGCGTEDAREITLPHLRDMVVLKRNDVKDRNGYCHDNGNSYYISSDGEYYFYVVCDIKSKWYRTTLSKDYLDKNVKPINNKEPTQKEYLQKLEDGSYKLVVLSDVVDGHEGLIEVPDGADKAIIRGEYLIFWKDDDGLLVKYNGNDTTISEGSLSFSRYMKAWNDAYIIWQRSNQNEGAWPVSSKSIIDVMQAHRTAEQINQDVMKHIIERGKTYDSEAGERSSDKTAVAFNAITGHKLKGSEVFLLLQILKDVRQWSKADYHKDSAEDSISYAVLKAEALENEN